MEKPLQRIATRQRRGPVRDALFGLLVSAIMIIMLISLSVVSNLARASNDAVAEPAPDSNAETIERHVAQHCDDLLTQVVPHEAVAPC